LRKQCWQVRRFCGLGKFQNKMPSDGFRKNKLVHWLGLVGAGPVFWEQFVIPQE